MSARRGDFARIGVMMLLHRVGGLQVNCSRCDADLGVAAGLAKVSDQRRNTSAADGPGGVPLPRHEFWRSALAERL